MSQGKAFSFAGNVNSGVAFNGRTIFAADAHRDEGNVSLCTRMKSRLRLLNWKESHRMTLVKIKTAQDSGCGVPSVRAAVEAA
jgi:hypothetical protein